MRKQRFYNPYISNVKKGVWDVILWQLGSYNDPMPPPRPPKDFSYPNNKLCLLKNKPKVTWINHSTFYLDVDGMGILTDPIFSKRCSPLPFVGPKRLHPPGIQIDNLPEIHFVIVSHDHYDHLDKASVKKLNRRFPNCNWVVPKGVGNWLQRQGVKNFHEHSWWEERLATNPVSNCQITFTAVPSQHFSGRCAWHSNGTLWAGWVVDFKLKDGTSKRLYFVGDTGYNPWDFKKIGERFSYMDLSLIPIGTYVPHEFMAPVHIDPEKAVRIHAEVNSKLSVGMHWKTFRLSSEDIEQPPYDLYLSLLEKNINPQTFRVINPGQTINW